MAMLADVRARQIPLVVATTGHTRRQKAEIEAAAHETAVLFSPNMSLVVNVLFKLTRLAAEALKGKGFDVEIVERHHRYKKDSPSGHGRALRRDHPGGAGRARSSTAARGWSASGRPDEIGDPRDPRRRQRRRAHDHLHDARRDAGAGPQGHSRDSYARGACWRPSSSPTARRGDTRWTTCWGSENATSDWSRAPAATFIPLLRRRGGPTCRRAAVVGGKHTDQLELVRSDFLVAVDPCSA